MSISKFASKVIGEKSVGATTRRASTSFPSPIAGRSKRLSAI